METLATYVFVLLAFLGFGGCVVLVVGVWRKCDILMRTGLNMLAAFAVAALISLCIGGILCLLSSLSGLRF